MLGWQHSYVSKMTYKPSQLVSFFVIRFHCMQDYKSLHAIVMICTTLVNRQTQREGQLLTIYTISSAS